MKKDKCIVDNGEVSYCDNFRQMMLAANGLDGVVDKKDNHISMSKSTMTFNVCPFCRVYIGGACEKK